MDSQLTTVFDNSDGITLRGGGGKGGKSSGSASASSGRRSAAGQRSSVESRFGAQAGNVAKQQAVLRNPNSTPEQRATAQRLIARNTGLALTGSSLRGSNAQQRAETQRSYNLLR